MVKHYLGLFVFLTIGVFVGVLWSKVEEPAATIVAPMTHSADQRTTAQLQQAANVEAELTQLKQRLDLLEQEVHKTDRTALVDNQSKYDLAPAGGELSASISRGMSSPVVDGLIKAGLDTFTAQQIARKQSAAELRRLELRDNAIREGYIGTERFREEIAQWREEEVRVRDEIDEASYDKYLYYTGRPNRVAVASVLLGSAAEQSGIQQGDMILRYEDEPLYSNRDLRTATIQGERDELVTLTVQRGDSRVTVSTQRGPLGVRLSPMSINPEQNQ
jgi:membrane-associated protease RseP (regulator of RpoE activity)